MSFFATQTVENEWHSGRPTDDAQNCPVEGPNAIIWLLCHYPDTDEADERVREVVQLHRQRGLPIWLFGSSTARYPESVERMIRQKLMFHGVRPDAIVCSGDFANSAPSFDTVQEAQNVVTAAKQQGVQTLICVSNRLQLLQVRALLRYELLTFVWIPTRLRDWRWWYVSSRLVLIPLAYFGVGPQFAPLVFVRWARGRLSAWPF